jgi:AraC-like DNA-binding protein
MDEKSRKNFQKWSEKVFEDFKVETSVSTDFFRADMRPTVAGQMILNTASATPHISARSSEMLKKADEIAFTAIFVKAGKIILEVGDKQVVVRPGEFGVLNSARPFRLITESAATEQAKYLILRLPHHLVDGNSDFSVETFSRDHAPARVFLQFIAELENSGADLGAGGIDLLSPAAAAILRNVISFDPNDNGRGDSGALHRVKEQIRVRIRDPAFDLKEIATSEGLSVRTIQRLFQEDGTTAMKWVMERRLLGAAADLKAPANTKSLVTAIAFSWGFNSSSHFSREFKNRFGVVPNIWRER